MDEGAGDFILEDVTQQPAAAAGGAGSGQLKASMDGAIAEALVKEGDTVEAGQTLVVLWLASVVDAVYSAIYIVTRWCTDVYLTRLLPRTESLVTIIIPVPLV